MAQLHSGHKEVLDHADLADMPDSGGSNTDHDARYYTETEVDTELAKYLKLDTTNDPLTGNLEISKADPEFRLTDTGNSAYMRQLLSDTNNTGIQYNVVQTPGSVGSAVDIQPGRRFQAAHNAVMNPGAGSFTWIGWLKLTAKDDFWFDHGYNSAGGYACWISNASSWLFSCDGGNVSISISPTDITDDAWHQIALVWNRATDKLLVYSDGAYRNQYDISAKGDLDKEATFWYGSVSGNANYDLHGLSDEFQMYNRALSADEITESWNGGNGIYGAVAAGGLVMGYHFDEGSGGTAADYSGNGVTLSEHGASAVWDTGKVQVPGADGEVVVWQSQDGLTAGEAGIQTFGNNAGETNIAGSEIIFDIGGTEQCEIKDGSIEPTTDDDIDLGASGAEFKDLYIDGSAYIDGLAENMLVATDKQIQFRDTDIHIESGADGELHASADSYIRLYTPAVVIGNGAAGVDYTLVFDGETNDGIFAWSEDEDFFIFSDDVRINSGEYLYFRDTGVYISSLDDGHLDLEADVSIDFNAKIGTNVGIHTAPSCPLDVLTTTSTAPVAKFGSAGAADYQSLQVYNGSGSLSIGIPGGAAQFVPDSAAGEPVLVTSNPLWVGDATSSWLKVADSGTTIGGGKAATDYTLTFNGETNDGVLTWMEDEDWFVHSDAVNFGLGARVTGSFVPASGAGMELLYANNISYVTSYDRTGGAWKAINLRGSEIKHSISGTDVGSWGAAGLTIGAGTAGTDYTLTFDGETNDGVLTWMEDEDYFEFQDEIRVPSYVRHIQIPVSISSSPANNPTAGEVGSASGYIFASGGTQEELHFQWEVPDDWAGDDITIEIDWCPYSGATSGTDTIKWVMEYRAIAEGESLENGSLASTSVTDDGDYAQYVVKHSPMTMTYNHADQPLTKQDHIFVRVYRDTTVANDFAGTVFATAFEVIYNSVAIPRV